MFRHEETSPVRVSTSVFIMLFGHDRAQSRLSVSVATVRGFAFLLVKKHFGGKNGIMSSLFLYCASVLRETAWGRFSFSQVYQKRLFSLCLCVRDWGASLALCWKPKQSDRLLGRHARRLLGGDIHLLGIWLNGDAEIKRNQQLNNRIDSSDFDFCYGFEEIETQKAWKYQ